MISLDSNMARSDRAEMNFRGNLQRLANLDILTISIADLDIEDGHLRPILAHLRLPFAKLCRRRAGIARELLVSPGRGSVRTCGVFLDHPMGVKDRGDAPDRFTHQLEPGER